MIEGKSKEYWIYWGLTSMIAAAVGGFVLPWLMRTDPFHLHEVVP
ncbi:MAG TPA: hypothetical protein VGP90_05950 [Acidimicrobiia bacterium]|jgi:hypothetical protein|nr:hypothetical protein [Acidimicrobiia bacterium]